MNADEKLMQAMRRRFGTPQNFLRSLGLDESLLPDIRENLTRSHDNNDPDQDDLGRKLAFVQSKLSNADFIKYVTLLIKDASGLAQEAGDRRTATDDLRRSGNLPTSGLRSGIIPSAPGAHDSAPTEASRKSFAELFGTTHMPGVA